jgi:ABC-type multidrug transport system ATPase subunit
VIDVRNVTKTYGPVRALVGVSWQLEDRSIGVVRGPNGSGKSTLLSILGTLARPSSGRVDHGTFGRTRQEVRRNLGWLGHDSLCYPDLTGRENIELAARLHGCDPKVSFARAAERFDLVAFAERPVRTYSRGQRQRVALARALVHGPRLLLLDEPTAGLDASSTERLTAVLREEVLSGATVIVVTHDARFADILAELGAGGIALERGRVVHQPGSVGGVR